MDHDTKQRFAQQLLNNQLLTDVIDQIRSTNIMLLESSTDPAVQQSAMAQMRALKKIQLTINSTIAEAIK